MDRTPNRITVMRLTDVFMPNMGISSGRMKLNILREAPESIEDSNFGLDSEYLNRQLAHQLLKEPTKDIIEETEAYILFRTGGSDGHIVLYLKKRDLLGYAVEFETIETPWIGKTVTQVSLWRAVAAPYVKGITTRIFFEYLLKNWPIVMSDSHQTKRGEEFWRGQMAYATTLGLKVGLADFEKKQIDWFDGDPSEFEDWLHVSDGWGVDRSYQGLRYLIGNP